MKFESLNPIQDNQVKRKSSIFQHKDLLSVMIKGEWCPIIFNQIDSVECGHIKYHKFALRLRPGLDYTFPVGTCEYIKDNYFLTTRDGIELRPLSKFFGDGMYEARVKERVFTNISGSALGLQQHKTLRVGKDYIVSKKILNPIE